MGDQNSTNRNRNSHRSSQSCRRSDEADQSGKSVVLALTGTDADRIGDFGDVVAEVAGPAHATVHLVRPFSETGFERTVDRLDYDADSPPDPDEVAKRSLTVREVATELRDPARNYGMPIVVHGRVDDDTGVAIVDIATEVDADRVIVGGQGRTPTGKAVFGSVAQYTLLNAPCPVTFVRGDES